MEAMMAKITSSYGPLVDSLRGLLDVDPSDVRRIVIDIQANHAPVVYIERFADEQLIDVIQTLGGVEIEWKGKTNG
jgi:ribosome-interacting GTPase 1